MKHASLKRILSLFLALIMVVGIIPANMIHAHETVTEEPAVVVEDGGNIVINDSSNVVVNALTKGVTNENTRVEIDYNYQQYQTDKDGNLIYDENGKPIPVTALNALSFESEKNRELTYTYPNSTKPLDFDYYWSSSNKTKWNQVYKGDYTCDGGKLRELLESTDPDHKYIVLMEDIKCTVDYGKDYDPIVITGEKVLDLNGHTLELYDKRNGTKDQSSDVDDHVSYMFEIKGTGETQGNQGRLGGALLTVLDSAGSNIIYTDPKGETGPYYSDRVGKVYANAYMINHQKWDFWNYTHRDIFLVTGGDLVIYGGEFQAGRQQDQFKTGFSWSALKEVIGQTVALGVSVYEYASGISAATAAKQDKMQEIYPQGQQETGDSDNGQAKDKGTTGKKTGGGGTEEKKTETPATAGTAANPEAKKDQTVAQKQNDQNKKEDENKKGDKGTENKKDDKKAAKNDKNTQIDTLNKNIAKAAMDKDKIMDMVDSALELGEGIYELFAKDNNTRCTACIQGTVARIGNECTMVIYGGTFIGHGSTPNVRNAVIETAYNSSLVTNVDTDPRYGKTKGGWVYVYDGIFEAYTGANVFNMYENAYNQKMDMYDVNPDGSVTLRENVPLLDCETYGIKEVRYKNYDAWKKAYNAMSDAQKEKADGPELVNTANISVRGGTFRCYYEYSNMAVLQNGRGTDTSDGQYCTTHEKYGDDCDDLDYNKFSGTPGSVNLGIESYDEDLIKDGRIQLVDVYGQGKLVLLDGGDPIEEEPEPDKINPATGLPYTDSELRDLDPDTGVAVEAPKTNYQTEGNFRHYRLYIGDQQLRSLAYLTVYPNTSITNSTFSFALETYWGTGTKTDLEWKSDDENIRAPYSSNEKFFDFEFDDTDTSSQNSGGAAGVYIIPQLNIPNALTAGEELHTSNVWYYNVPVNRYGETLGNVEVSDTYLETNSSVNGEKFVASFNKTKKSGEVYTEKFAWSLNDFKSWGGTYYNQTDANYKTNIKFFTYKIYRVDPLSRENINESDNWSDNEPLLEVRYGTGTDSLRCKLTLVKLEEQIRKAMREKHPEENWTGFSSGELYRVVFTVEEQVGFGYMGTQYDGEVKYLDTLNTARAQSSILFRCVSVNEYKEGTHENATTGTTAIGRVPDWTPLQFRGDVKAGDYANVELVNGQTALVDWQGVRVFDIYYQWYLLDSPDDETPTLIGGTDNVWVAQNSAGGKKNHKPRNFILKNDGSGVGINGELYANTVDPNSAEATMYDYGPNGLPTNSRLWTGEMLHMYTYETCPEDPGMKIDQNDDLYMANNNTFWGNSDSLYIPEEYAGQGKYLQVKVVAVNVRYPHLYDNLQTIASHVVPIGSYAERTDMEMSAPYNTDTATSLSATIAGDAAYIHYDSWSEILSDGTLRPMDLNEHFEPGKDYRYYVWIYPGTNYAFSDDHRLYINGNYTQKLSKFEYTMDFTARTKLTAAVDQETVTVAEGTKAVLKVIANGDGVKYHWEVDSANAPYHSTGNYFWDYHISDTMGYVGTHTYKCTVSDKYGDSVDLYVTLKIVRNEDLYITAAAVVPGVNGNQLTYEEIMAKSGTRNSLSAAVSMQLQDSVYDAVFSVNPGAKFEMYASYIMIPNEYKWINWEGKTYGYYDDTTTYSYVVTRTGVEGDITYEWGTSGTTPSGMAPSSQIEKLGEDSTYTWTAPTEPGIYYLRLKITNTITLSNGKTKSDSSYVYFGVEVIDDAAPTLCGTINAHGKEDDTLTVELFKAGESEPVKTMTATGNMASYSFTGIEAGQYTIKATKACCQVYSATVTVGAGVNNHNIVLVENHNWLAANCVTPETCADCGTTRGVAGDHDYSIPATCETPAQCSGCGMYKGYALGHSWVNANCDTPKTCTTCGATEGSALGHEWVEATCTDPKHCMNCPATEGTTVSHTYVNGICNCGAKQTAQLDATIKMNHTLNLASDISANFAIAKSLLTGYDMTTAYVEFEIDTYSGNEKTGTKSTKVAGVLNGSYYYFTFNGLNATMMNDDIRATFYGTKDGVPYKSNVDTYSVATYAYSQLNKTAAKATLKTLCADLLRYGSTAQSYKKYRTDALANAAMTETHKSYLSDDSAVTFDNYNNETSPITNPKITFVGKILILDSKVTLRYVVDLSNYTGDMADLKLVVNYTGIDGTQKSETLTELTVYNEAKKQYYFELDTLLAAELRQKISVAVYSGSTRMTAVQNYSVSTYGNGKKGDLLTLIKHLMCYSDSARAYFVG